jgi:uncharacterized protein
MKNTPLQIGELKIQPGERITLALPTPILYTCAPMHIPIHVIHGKQKGPCLLICAAIHGDEANGIATIQKLLDLRLFKHLKGTLIAVPVVNIYGLISQSRALPDGRDLEKAFPGLLEGSYASRLAYLFNKEILQKADYCIDLHSSEPYTEKLPQVFTNLNIDAGKELATAFNPPVILNTTDTKGLLFLMNEKHENSIPTLLYEAGEALRLNSLAIRVGLKGILNIMRYLDMIPKKKKTSPESQSLFIDEQQWLYSPCSGLCQMFKKNGSYVKKEELIAHVSDPFGSKQTSKITSPFDGIIISQKNLPLINEGEPIIQIAKYLKKVEMSSHFENSEDITNNE